MVLIFFCIFVIRYCFKFFKIWQDQILFPITFFILKAFDMVQKKYIQKVVQILLNCKEYVYLISFLFTEVALPKPSWNIF